MSKHSLQKHTPSLATSRCYNNTMRVSDLIPHQIKRSRAPTARSQHVGAQARNWSGFQLLRQIAIHSHPLDYVRRTLAKDVTTPCGDVSHRADNPSLRQPPLWRGFESTGAGVANCAAFLPRSRASRGVPSSAVSSLRSFVLTESRLHFRS